MAGPNEQILPPGMGGAAPTPQIPGAPVGSSVIVMPNPTPSAPAPAATAQPQLTYEQYQRQFAQPAPAAAAPVEAPALPVNPMLTTMQPPAAPTPAPAQAPAPLPTPPVVPEPPKPTTAPVTVTDLAAHLGSDPAIAPGIAYLEAAATAAQLDIQRAFGNAADELDARFIDRAYLTEKVGAEQAAQMVKVAEASIAYAAQHRENLFGEVRAVAGDTEKWNQAVELFNKHADERTKKILSAQFDSMDRDQMMDAAQRLVAFAAQTGGMVQTGTGQPLGAPGAVQGLSAEQYREALTKLPRNAPDSAYEALRTQRAAGLKAGI